MDKNMLKRWFNGLYGKLPPEQRLEELEKMKNYVEELAEAKRGHLKEARRAARFAGVIL